ncbi:hypothetical protein P7C70_g106, partial [Phenoliferia sp. Uapishka_3]
MSSGLRDRDATNLLDLPDEILAIIVRAIAPSGGRKAHTMRLVNRHLSTIATPIFFASLQVPDSTSIAYDELLAAILTDRTAMYEPSSSIVYHLRGNTRHSLPAAAIESLINLRRVSLSAAPRAQLSDVIRRAIVSLPQLHTLSLAGFAVNTKSFAEGSLLENCPGLRRLILQNMSGDGVYASESEEKDSLRITIAASSLEALEVYNPAVSAGEGETRYAIFAMFACRNSVREVELELEDAGRNVADPQLAERLLPDNAKSMRIQGLVSLFSAKPDLAKHSITSTYLVTFLNAIGKFSRLPELSLPVTNRFDVHPVLLSLRMPHIRYLSLSTSHRATYEHKPDLLTSGGPPVWRWRRTS